MSLLDNMRGPQLKTPLLFLLLLLSSLPGTAFCEEEDTSPTTHSTTTEDSTHSDGSNQDEVSEDTNPTGPSTISQTTPRGDLEGSGSGETEPLPVSGIDNSNLTDQQDEDSSPPYLILVSVVSVVLVVIIVGAIVCSIVIWRRRSKKAGNQELSKEDPHLEGSSTEKVPMPMFEEDVPSVLELEMEELDQWMKKDS